MNLPPITDVQKAVVPYLADLRASHDRLLAAAKAAIDNLCDLAPTGSAEIIDQLEIAIDAAEEQEPKL